VAISTRKSVGVVDEDFDTFQRSATCRDVDAATMDPPAVASTNSADDSCIVRTHVARTGRIAPPTAVVKVGGVTEPIGQAPVVGPARPDSGAERQRIG